MRPIFHFHVRHEVSYMVYRLVKLSTDLTKATDALQNWGQGEGDDLGVRSIWVTELPSSADITLGCPERVPQAPYSFRFFCIPLCLARTGYS